MSSSVLREKALAARLVFGDALRDSDDEDSDDDHQNNDNNSSGGVPKEIKLDAAAADTSSSSLMYSVSPRKGNNNKREESSFSTTTTTTSNNRSNSSNRSVTSSSSTQQQHQRLSHSSSNTNNRKKDDDEKPSALERLQHQRQSSSSNGSGGGGGGSGSSYSRISRRSRDTYYRSNKNNNNYYENVIGPFDKIIGTDDNNTEDRHQSTTSTTMSGGGAGGGGGKENDTTTTSAGTDGNQKKPAALSSSAPRQRQIPHHHHGPRNNNNNNNRVAEQQQQQQQQQQAQRRQQQRRDLFQQTQRAIDQASASLSVNQSLQRAVQAKNKNHKFKSRQTARVKFEMQQEQEDIKAFNRRMEETRLKNLKQKRELSSKASKQKGQQHLTHKHVALKAIVKESEFKSSVFRDHQDKLLLEKTNRRRMSNDARAKVRDDHRRGEHKLQLQRIEEDQAVIDERCEYSLAKRETDRALAEQRRDSFVGRGITFVKQREAAREYKEEKEKAERESYELKRGGDMDAVQHKLDMAKERRDSFISRNLYAREQRMDEEQKRSDELLAEQKSYELKFEADRDVDAHKLRMEKERRKSLQERNKKGAEYAMVMNELKDIARQKEMELLVSKWAGEEDAKEYLLDMEEKRRESLRGRGERVVHHRQVDREQREKELENAQKDEELKAGAQKDVEAEKKRCAERDRASLKYRGVENQKRRLEENIRQEEQRKTDSDNFELDRLAQEDIKYYIDHCKKERRKSLATRARDTRKHVEWRQRRAEQEREARSRDVRDRLMDARHAELARHEERARQALDAIEHASKGCSFNPFLGLL